MPKSFLSSSAVSFCHFSFPLLSQASKELPTVPAFSSFLHNSYNLGPSAITLPALPPPKSFQCLLWVHTVLGLSATLDSFGPSLLETVLASLTLYSLDFCNLLNGLSLSHLRLAHTLPST